MKKLLSILTMVVLIFAVFVGCSLKPQNSAADKGEQVLVVNKEKKEVKILAEVNGKYFTESTRHGVVFKDGSNGEKSLLRGLANQVDFYNAVESLGAKPGNNVKMADMTKGVKVQGSKLNVFVTWEGLGKEIPFNDIISSSDQRPMDIRFGGNIENAKTMNTGCILCLDSCAVGITSNASYETGASKTVKFYGEKDVLPKDGTKVTVIFRFAE
ncbi:YdjY domain-containing protein [Clostridium sp. FP1]|uniref:YdjY domain-containing protein n=1 Tax=Clostridium sp. FP1 TaxID=2724076 RepID=UPI0013E992B7|nr:YdjY domain-containing protein [Clostridium sp. FP1]MBZ9634739.1 YdjY domain-containing protein [Clostridium sp. FP1]